MQERKRHKVPKSETRMGPKPFDPGQPVSGAAIRHRRLHPAIDLSAAKLGRLVGVSGASILAWETGERKPSAAQLRRLAKALRCSPAELAADPRL